MLTPLCAWCAFFRGPEFTLAAALFSGPFGRMGVLVARTPVRSPRRLRPPFMIERRRHHVGNIDLATTAPLGGCWPTAASLPCQGLACSGRLGASNARRPAPSLDPPRPADSTPGA